MSGNGLQRNDKDFQLHLYDKLWENIIHKDNRLWTFLAIYGVCRQYCNWEDGYKCNRG